LLSIFQQLHEAGGCDLRVMPGAGIELTAKFCFNVANKHVTQMTNDRCRVTKVEVWEHDANSAICTK